MNIIFDLDGVLRDLNKYISKALNVPYPETWDVKYGGKSIPDIINEDLDLLRNAPPTTYLRVALERCDPVVIWTDQPHVWKWYTSQWIYKNIGVPMCGHVEVRYKDSFQKVIDLSNLENTILIEDSPNLESYDNILLIDRPYNRGVKDAVKIFGPRHLDSFLSFLIPR
jgi:hypothetical protein